jgi:hypothetical protein
MAQTVPTKASVTEFIASIPDATKRNDSFMLVHMMREISGFEPVMWGPAIIGFGSYHYKYASGHEGDAPVLGFSPRKNALTLYLILRENEKETLLTHLGKHTTGKVCLYIKRLSDVDLDVLKKLIAATLAYMDGKY